MSKQLSRTGIAIFLAVIMVAGVAVGPAMGAAPTTVPTFDDDTTGATSFTSEVGDEDVIPSYNGTDNETRQFTTTVANTTTPELKVLANASGNVLARNESMVNITGASGVGSPSGAFWNASFDESDWAEVDRAINENVTLDAIVYNSTNESDDGEIQFHLNNTNETSVENIDDSDVDAEDIVDVTSDDGFFGLVFDNAFSEVDTDERAIAGDETDVIIVFSNSSVNDDFDNATDDLDEGDIVWGAASSLDGDESGLTPVFVYNEEIPDDVDDDEDTYGVYQDYGGEQAIVFNLGESWEDDDEVEVRSIGGADFFQQREVYGIVTVATRGAVDFRFTDLVGMIGGDSGLVTLAVTPLLLAAKEAEPGEIIWDEEE